MTMDHLIFSHIQTRPLAAKDTPSVMPLSPDLGISTIQVKKVPTGWQLPDGGVLTFSHIQTISENENGCFIFQNNQLQKSETFSTRTNRYYSLMPTAAAPTMLISGIPMHRIKDTTPDVDTQRKIKALGKPFGRILDTATGLGYTAIQAAQTARELITIEFDPAVLSLCRLNPWSGELFNNPKIQKIIGDSFDLVQSFPDSSFDAIIHDPPTFSLAGHLYSLAIYQVFYRILKPQGRLFHYIGNPESRTGASVTHGAVKRLTQAGFSVSPKPRAFGVLAKKIDQSGQEQIPHFNGQAPCYHV